MMNKEEFFEDFVDAEDWAMDDMTDANDAAAEAEEANPFWAVDEDEPEVDVRTVLMAKASMVALLGLKTSPRGGVIVRVDPREDQPAAQIYNDPSAATKWFNRSLATSRKNGWYIIYDGEPMYG